MLHCVLRLQRLGIQLLFVFDGPNRPPKHGKRAPITQAADTRLWRETLWNIGTPFHDAPGEAEAECARLEQLDLVDAV
jgi:Holliday junction resolvase YEN1